MAPLPRLVLVDGLPGTGKTTTAERVFEGLRGRGIDCAWAREEAKPHPVFGPGILAARRQPEFPALCIEAWTRFVAQTDRICVLDGAALQSTVRFMFEQRVADVDITAYWQAFETIVAPARPVLMYLRDPNPAQRLRRHAIRERGREWYEKLADHVARTPAGRPFRHLGVDGFVEFWVRYGALCDELLAASELTVQRTRPPITPIQTMRDVLLPQ